MVEIEMNKLEANKDPINFFIKTDSYVTSNNTLNHSAYTPTYLLTPLSLRDRRSHLNKENNNKQQYVTQRGKMWMYLGVIMFFLDHHFCVLAGIIVGGVGSSTEPHKPATVGM